MSLVWEFTLLCLHLNILFLACHFPGISNGVADAPSPQQMLMFKMLALEGGLLPA